MISDILDLDDPMFGEEQSGQPFYISDDDDEETDETDGELKVLFNNTTFIIGAACTYIECKVYTCQTRYTSYSDSEAEARAAIGSGGMRGGQRQQQRSMYSSSVPITVPMWDPQPRTSQAPTNQRSLEEEDEDDVCIFLYSPSYHVTNHNLSLFYLAGVLKNVRREG